MEHDIAIKIENISKTFKIPHDKISTVRGAFVKIFSRKSYEEFNALNNVSFDVKKGEFLGIIGRNGSGKSTLLKILAGIYEADKGKMHINGRISPFLELGIGFNPDLSGRDNIYLNATVLGLTKKQIDKKFDEIVAFSELERFIDQKLKNYSSGMKVRLAFSVSIYANRDILLMDEVLAVGDNNFQAKCLSEFLKYKKEGKTVILVTHDMSTAQKYCDRLMLLRNGNVEIIGSSDDVVKEYIYQNMSDEEEKIVIENENIKPRIKDDICIENNSEDCKSKKRRGDGRIVLSKIEILDTEGKSRRVFNPFDSLIIRVYYTTKSDVKKAVFGIEIFNESNRRLFGFNTSMEKKSIGIKPEGGYVDFKLKDIPFVSGKYYITPAIANELCNIQHDYWEEADYFEIINNNYSTAVFGDVNIKLDVDDERL